ncbi:uncharacterized protein FOMMEDRAFT_23357 [Fomitiporia mediterranea MF3/22]|uniref:uncharacterized protein n=1 Tax=Fomitiporia mediterranea (strain MF3/22) TaxID=694068 RepID=UPI0004408962|nr:uncharacterized protein FOMMEDRAFT_23357 [Fomitiporia mediterranea MF3/22]EJC98997.1 hypothetical protein FOMMEDRAFT_23357 [Fomitiporia mediterranea MF3/22]
MGRGWSCDESFAIRIAALAPGPVINIITLYLHPETLAREHIRRTGVRYLLCASALAGPSCHANQIRRVIQPSYQHRDGQAVGRSQLEEYSHVVRYALKPGTITGAVQIITIPITSAQEYYLTRPCPKFALRDLLPHEQNSLPS